MDNNNNPTVSQIQAIPIYKGDLKQMKQRMPKMTVIHESRNSKIYRAIDSQAKSVAE